MAEHSRIEDLRRRVERDPASIAFAQLAEEYRRIGDCEAAVRVCEAGLARHPEYISARVTLGRALLELGRLEDARTEFTRVLEAAPGNLVAAGKLAEIHQRTSEARSREARSEPRSASSTARPRQSSADDGVLGRLEAWLEAIGEIRTRRGHRV